MVRNARVEVVLIEVAEVGISSTRSGVCWRSKSNENHEVMDSLTEWEKH